MNDSGSTVANGKVYPSPEAALDGISQGATVLIGGFAGLGSPNGLLGALRNSGVGDLTCICQGAWPQSPEMMDVSELVANGQVRKLITPLAFYPGSGGPLQERWLSGDLEIETIPPGVLAERLRAGGAGLAGVFLPAVPGSRFQSDKEVQTFGGQDFVFESALRADFALLKAEEADTLGNLIYRGSQRNWNPVMAMAGRVSIAEVARIHEPGGIDPEVVITPGIFVNRVVQMN
jgi:3-oxoacid CoA-transferase A subunit